MGQEKEKPLTEREKFALAVIEASLKVVKAAQNNDAEGAVKVLDDFLEQNVKPKLVKK